MPKRGKHPQLTGTFVTVVLLGYGRLGYGALCHLGTQIMLLMYDALDILLLGSSLGLYWISLAHFSILR
jgi:hypothetical protein